MPNFSLISTAEQEHVICTKPGVSLLSCVFYGFNFVVKLDYSFLHQISLIKILFLRYTAVPLSYTFDRLLPYSSIVQAPSWKTGRYEFDH